VEIGAIRLTFHLPDNNSLKGKRQVSRSLISRLRQKFNVAVAEVDGQDRWQTLVVGVVCVSNKQHHANQMLDTVLRYVNALPLDAELVDVERETMGDV
jgi:uncharacterized protein YlxP (DUF503 family)